jgi:hypothetical protein
MIPRDLFESEPLEESTLTETKPETKASTVADSVMSTQPAAQSSSNEVSPMISKKQPGKKEILPDPTNELYTPIKALSTFNYDWRLKARLVKVYPKRFYKSNKGCLLNIEIMDMHGTQIQATFFNDACEKFEPLL